MSDNTKEINERRFFTGFVVSKEFIEKALPTLDQVLPLYDAEHLPAVVTLCVEYYHTYGRAPGRDIEGIYLKYTQTHRTKPSDIEEVMKIFNLINQDYQEGIHADSLWDDYIAYFEKRHLEDFRDNASEEELRDGYQPIPFETVLKPNSIRATDIQIQSVEWLHKNRIPANKVVVFFGEIGIGKSNITVDYAARITRADMAPANEGRLPGGHVLVATAEDDPDDTWVPRFLAAGGIRNRLHFIDDNILWTFADLSPLEHELKAHRGRTRLLIIDTPNDYIPPEINANNTSHVRLRILHPLKRLAKQYKVTILLVMHPIKGEGGRAAEKISGSYAWIAAPRSVYIFVKDHVDPTRRLMVPVRVSNAPEMDALAYRIEEDENEQPVINWQKRTIRITADQAIQTIKQPQTDTEVRHEWLRRLLVEAGSDGMLAEKIFELAKEPKYEESQLYRSFTAINAERGKTKEFQSRAVWYAQGMMPKAPVSDLAKKVGKDARKRSS